MGRLTSDPGRSGSESCERIYSDYRRAVYGWAASALRDHYAAEDVAQEVFIAVLRALPAHLRASPAALAAWLATTTSRQVVQTTRRRTVLTSPEPSRTQAERGELDRGIERA